MAPEPSVPNFDFDIPPLPPIRSEVMRTRQAYTSKVVKKMRSSRRGAVVSESD